MTERPAPALIEIVERVRGTSADAAALDAVAGYIKPNEVRINGVPIAVPADESIQVHEIGLRADDLVRVTLTLFARRVIIGAEPGVADDGEVYAQRTRSAVLSERYGLDVWVDPLCPPGAAYIITGPAAVLTEDDVFPEKDPHPVKATATITAVTPVACPVCSPSGDPEEPLAEWLLCAKHTKETR